MYAQAPTYHKGVVTTLMALGTATMGMLATLHLTGQMPTGTSWILGAAAALNGAVLVFVWSKRETLFPAQKAGAENGAEDATPATGMTVGAAVGTIGAAMVIMAALFATKYYVDMAAFVDNVFATAPGTDGVATTVDGQQGTLVPFAGTMKRGVFCPEGAAPQAYFMLRNGGETLRAVPQDAMAQAEAVCNAA